MHQPLANPPRAAPTPVATAAPTAQQRAAAAAAGVGRPQHVTTAGPLPPPPPPRPPPPPAPALLAAVAAAAPVPSPPWHHLWTACQRLRDGRWWPRRSPATVGCPTPATTSTWGKQIHNNLSTLGQGLMTGTEKSPRAALAEESAGGSANATLPERWSSPLSNSLFAVRGTRRWGACHWPVPHHLCDSSIRWTS